MPALPISLFERAAARILLAAVCTSCAGCKAREMGVRFADKQASTVDDTWVAAAKSCWPSLAQGSYTTEGLKYYLADPLHFRATFSTYSFLTDSALGTLAAKPLLSAPAPDSTSLAHTQKTVLSRAQALAGTTAAAAAAANPNGTAQPDALCAVNAGIPVGFK